MQLWQLLLIYVVGLGVLLYFTAILPGKRKNKATQKMHAEIAVGDLVSTIGGIVGTVVKRTEDSVYIKVDEANGTTKVKSLLQERMNDIRKCRSDAT